MTAKEILAKVKAIFAEVIPAATQATKTATPFKLDNGTDISIMIDDPAVSMAPDAGDMVMIAGVAAAAGDYTLDNGDKFTVDATGMITMYTVAPAITQTPEEMAAAEAARRAAAAPAAAAAGPVQNVSQFSAELPTKEKMTEDFNGMLAKFATGTPEERIANLELVARALMESCFGWQIREAQQKAAADQAIAIYKQDLITSQAAVTAATAKLSKHEKTIAGMFELVEVLVKEPVTDPLTLTGGKKDGFAAKKEARIQALADAVKKNKEEHAKQG